MHDVTKRKWRPSTISMIKSNGRAIDNMKEQIEEESRGNLEA